MTPFPPPGYIPTDSAIAGIEVYMPASDKEDRREVVAFNCPQCGGLQAYSVEDGGLTCTFCNYYEPPATTTIGRAAESFEFTVETMERVAHGWGATRKEIACQNCSARTSVAANSLTHTCPFCGSNKVIQRQAPQDTLRPRFVVPFQIKSETCRETMRHWLGNSWLLPTDLQRLGTGTPFTAIYLPFWTFDANTQADWKAEVHKKRKSGKHTHYYWRWESGDVQHDFDDLLVPGATKVSRKLLRDIHPFNLDALTPYDPSYLAGLKAQAYEIQLDQAWGVARRKMREQVKERCRAQASAPKLRNFSMNLSYKDESWRYILLPLYLAAYTYNGKTYQVLLNGQTGEISGQRPAAWRKIFTLSFAIIAPAILLFLAALWLPLPGDIPAFLTAFSMIAFTVGLIALIVMSARAAKLDDV